MPSTLNPREHLFLFLKPHTSIAPTATGRGRFLLFLSQITPDTFISLPVPLADLLAGVHVIGSITHIRNRNTSTLTLAFDSYASEPAILNRLEEVMSQHHWQSTWSTWDRWMALRFVPPPLPCVVPSYVPSLRCLALGRMTTH